MYSKLHNIFADKTGGDIFVCYGLWHWFYIIATIATIATLIYLFKNKEQSAKEKVLKVLIGLAFGLYIADFFLMPFAYGEIDVDKLPFHACTSMCTMGFISNYNRFLKKYRLNFALIGLVSNIMYLSYPSGVMSYEISPLSYRAVQTLLFHSIMTVYGLMVLTFEEGGPQIKRCYRDVAILGILAVWSIIGNALYSGSAEDYSRDFNWFFVKSDPFGLLPEEWARYVLPQINIIAFFAAEMLFYLAFMFINKKIKQTKKELQPA